MQCPGTSCRYSSLLQTFCFWTNPSWEIDARKQQDPGAAQPQAQRRPRRGNGSVQPSFPELWALGVTECCTRAVPQI